MNKVLNQFIAKMKSINRGSYLKIALGIVVFIILIWVLSCFYGIWHENNLLKKYTLDSEKKQFVEWILADKQALANNPKRAELIGTTMDVGLQWYNLMEYELAAKWWKKGLDIEPNNDIGWYNLGNAQRELKNYWRATRAYRKSMEVAQPGEIDGCLALGEMYRYADTSNKDKEDNVYLECLKKHKDNRDLIARLALYYKDSGDVKNAILYFDKLWSIEPTMEVSEELRSLRMLEGQGAVKK